MALGIDASNRSVTTAISNTVALTTTLVNDVIVVMVECNGGPVVSVTASGLTFSFRASSSPGGTFPFEEWWAPASATFSGNITVTQTSSAFLVIDAFGVNGAANINAPFDGSPVTNASAYVSINTVNPHCFIFGGVRDTNVNVASGGGWTQIQGGNNNMCTEYQVVSTPQSGLAVTFAGTSTNGAVADAITSDSPVNPAAGGGSSFGIVQATRMIGT